MFCTHCGAQVSDGATFCTSCGHPLGTASGENGASALPKRGRPVAGQKSGRGFPTKIVAAVVASVLAISVLGGAFGGGSGSDGSGAEEQQEQQAPTYSTFEEYLSYYPDWLQNMQASANDVVASNEELSAWEVRVSGNQIVYDITVSEDYTLGAGLIELFEGFCGGSGDISKLIETLGVSAYLPTDHNALETVESIESRTGLDGVTLQYRFWWSSGSELAQSKVYHS